MPVLNSGVRVGAAAFALGLSLAGPQALGVAVADGAGTDSAVKTAGPAAPSRSASGACRYTSVAKVVMPSSPD